MFFRWKRRPIKQNFEILKFLRISVLSQGYSQVIMPYLFYKNMLIRVFLHAEFIFAMKTFQNPKIFMKNANYRKMNNFGNFCKFFDIFTETLEQNIRKCQKTCFLDGKEDK